MKLIDKEKLLKEIENEYDLNYGEILLNPNGFVDLVNKQPTVDFDNKKREITRELLGREKSAIRKINDYSCVGSEYPIRREEKYIKQFISELEKEYPTVLFRILNGNPR